MAREIDANLSRALERDLRVGSEPGAAAVDAESGGRGGGAAGSVVHFDAGDLEALSAFSSSFGGLPAIRLGLVDISKTKEIQYSWTGQSLPRG